MTNVCFAHIINENLGDAFCCPKSHFSEFAGCPQLDFRWLPAEMSKPPWTLVVGGGGMLHPGVDTWIQARSNAQRVILWGIGVNYHDGAPIPAWRECVKNCALVAIRDADECGSGIRWCPCPSCLAPEFDSARDLTPTQDAVCFEHYQHRMRLPYSTRNNLRDRGWQFKEAITFLASGRRVITNSFHGAYWGALLGRPVLIYKPFSTRFRSGLSHRNFANTEEEVRSWLTRDAVVPSSDYLESCRTANWGIFRHVLSLL